MTRFRYRTGAGRIMTSVVLSALVTALGLGCSDAERSRTSSSDCSQEWITIIETLLLPQNAWTANIDNSRIEVDSPGIRKVAAMGKAALPPLLAMMRDESLSFHTFTCCAAACERIIRGHDSGYRLPWDGGLRVSRLTTGILLEPDGQIDPLQFRRDTANAVEAECRSLGLIKKQ